VAGHATFGLCQRCVSVGNVYEGNGGERGSDQYSNLFHVESLDKTGASLTEARAMVQKH
jgi:hypothetical protein